MSIENTDGPQISLGKKESRERIGRYLNIQELTSLTIFKWRYMLMDLGFNKEEICNLIEIKWKAFKGQYKE